jgi:N-methylhydantoinase A/oxoprolinase/acetone carboxylase beta subunit
MMSISLGVDTGGTYTDAVLIRDEKEIIASAKSLTTRHDLAIGVSKAVARVLQISGISPSEIGLASLSTTLATNALVEGQGGRVALIFIGFQEKDLDTSGLRDALKSAPYIVLSGGHTHAGVEKAPLDESALRPFLEMHKNEVSAYAVAGQFAVRNAAHELRAMELVHEITARPVSASHQLSAKLGGPKRALTAVLNARLIGLIDKLITRAETALGEMGIAAPLMVVRGDGALISADQARGKPIETILSGPAASIVGARWMSDASDALVSDIGGTTTDVALLRGGRPLIDPQGAQVGPYRTMVEAVAMRTTGLGGDSEIHVITTGLSGGLSLGPRRVVPISLMAHENPDMVHEALDASLRSVAPSEHDACFVRPVIGVSREGLAERDVKFLARLDAGAQPLAKVLRTRMDHASLKRLVARGIAQMSGITPSDAAHVLGCINHWDVKAAEKALELLARKRIGSGEQLAKSATEMAQMIVDQLTHQTSLALLEAAFAEESTDFALAPDQLARHVLMQRGLDDYRGILRLSTGLNVPVIGLGASAQTYYPMVGARLGTKMLLPEHAGVANAIGAVVGRITMRLSGSVTSPSEGQFVVHYGPEPQIFSQKEAALDKLRRQLQTQAIERAKEAGAEDIQMSESLTERTATVEAREIFVEATLTIEASGRPTIT